MADLSPYLLRNYPRLATAALFLPRENPTFGNPPFAEADGKIMIVRLSPFRDAEASLAHLFLFPEARMAFPKGYIDMSFFPSAPDRRVFDRDGIPYLFGLQSLRPAQDFEILLISNSCLLELVNLPLLLIRSGLPVWSRERDERHPLIIMGGSNASASGAIVGPDGESMVDGIFFGEGEEQVGPLLRSFRESRGKDRRVRLAAAAAGVPAFWAAGSPEKEVVKAVVQARGPTEEFHELARIDANESGVGPAKINREFTRIDANGPGFGLANELRIARISRIGPGFGPEAPPAYPVLNGEEADTARLAISRGCPGSCSFCFECYDRRPYREIPAKEILAAALDRKRASGARNLEVMSFTFNAHREIFDLIFDLNALCERVGFKSQRSDLLVSRAGLIAAEIAAGKRSFTLGIEGISERLRAFLNKALAAPEITVVLDELLRRGVREIKLFYLLTGHEGQDDIREFREFIAGWAARRKSGESSRVIFSFGYLVRMPLTPLQYDRLFLEEREWKGIVEEVFAACTAAGFEARLAMEWKDYCVSQVLALGGGRLAGALVEFARWGYCYDGSLSPRYWPALQGWLEGKGLWNREFLGEKDAEHPFPFSFLRSPVSGDLLYSEYLRIRGGDAAGNESGGKKTGKIPGCILRPNRQANSNETGREYLDRLAALMRGKERIKPAYYRARLGREFAGLQPAAAEALILRGLFAARPSLAGRVLSAREALFSAAAWDGRFEGVWGETVVAVRALAMDGMDEMDAMDDMDIGGSLRLLGRIKSFTPGEFLRAEVAISVGEGRPGARRRFEEHLKKCRIAFHLVREGEGYRLEIAEKSRKNLLCEGRFREGRGFAASLVCGPRFDLAGLLSALIGGGHPGAVGAEVRSLVI
jgi:radical SAM superfamily enzyme YgiQ (UPF0313 family)